MRLVAGADAHPLTCLSAQERGFALRNGHNYAHRLVARLAAAGAWAGGAEDGVVRVSLLHYNTPGEVAALIDALEGLL